MPFGLATMTRAKSGAFSVRKAIPADVRPEYKRLYGLSSEATLTLPASMRPQEAKAQQAEFLATVERRIQAIRDAKAGRTLSLSERDALALAGEWYRRYTTQHEDNPGSPKRWEGISEGLDALLDRAVTQVERLHWREGRRDNAATRPGRNQAGRHLGDTDHAGSGNGEDMRAAHGAAA